MGDKQRVYTFLDGEHLTKLDEKAGELGVSRSEVIRISIEQYLTSNGENDLTTKDQAITLLKKDLENMERLIQMKDGEIQHLRYTTNDLRQLATNLAAKVPALPAPTTTQEPVQPQTKTPLWMRLRFWTWI